MTHYGPSHVSHMTHYSPSHVSHMTHLVQVRSSGNALNESNKRGRPLYCGPGASDNGSVVGHPTMGHSQGGVERVVSRVGTEVWLDSQPSWSAVPCKGTSRLQPVSDDLRRGEGNLLKYHHKERKAL